MIGFSRWEYHTTHPKGIYCPTSGTWELKNEMSTPIQQLHTLIPPSWKSVTFLEQFHLQSFSAHLYLSHLHVMYLPMLCHFLLLTRITMNFTFVFIFCLCHICLQIRIVPPSPSYTLRSSTGIVFLLFFPNTEIRHASCRYEI